MTPGTRTKLIGFSALGLASSATSTYVHYQLLTDRGYTSFCDVSSTVSCTQAYLSHYGSLWGVPVAVIGLFFFALVLSLSFFGGRRDPSAGESTPGYVFALSTLALAMVLYLAYGSYFVLHTFCILCAVTYVAVIGLFIVSGGATPFPMTTLPRRALHDVRSMLASPAALAIALLFVVGGALVATAFPREGGPGTIPAASATASYQPLTDQQRSEVERWFDMQPKVDMPILSDGAKVLVVKFNDYQCPPCRQSYEAYGPILEKYKAQGVKFVLKHFPLDPECNSAAPGGAHRAACEAAAAVVMARAKNDGSAERLEAWLFTNQGPPQLTPEQVKDAARTVAGITDFDARYEKALVEVKNDAGMGALLGAKSTPTFFIDGRLIAGMVPAPVFEALLELELKRAK
ncbi:MAG TPA: vitamin K epoxide reductase family protein [Vicinamibacterales bacterium]|nr:vitamin K epoxide reductase family protein [Vicinamibacterales bacterium]